MTEIWKPVKDFEDYCVSNLGRIKSIKFNRERICDSLKGNYYIITLYGKERKRMTYVHRLIAETFLEYSKSNSDDIENNNFKLDSYINKRNSRNLILKNQQL